MSHAPMTVEEPVATVEGPCARGAAHDACPDAATCGLVRLLRDLIYADSAELAEAATESKALVERVESLEREIKRLQRGGGKS